MEILVVEDSEDTLTLLSTIFGQEGALVITASSAHEALRKVEQRRPDLIVSDIGMPDTDGYTLMKQLKLLPNLKEVPAIAVSGYASDEDRARALEVGYIALIPKPIDVDNLFLLIQNLLHPSVPANN